MGARIALLLAYSTAGFTFTAVVFIREGAVNCEGSGMDIFLLLREVCESRESESEPEEEEDSASDSESSKELDISSSDISATGASFALASLGLILEIVLAIEFCGQLFFWR